MNHDDLSRALIDVRKAYRLLYLFQGRVLDLVEEISTKLEHDFYYWLPSGNEEAVRGGANPCDRSAWKMLPLFDACFLYLPPGVKSTDTPRQGQWLLEIIVCPDDGEPEGGKGEPNPVEFGDPAKCSSKIYLYAFIVQHDLEGTDWWRGVYQNSEWPDADGVIKANGSGAWTIGLSRDIASLTDSTAVDEFANCFRQFVSAHGGSLD